MINKEKMQIISNYVDSLFPNAKCELFYNKDYELAIAVMLSAQTTGNAVNAVTYTLFKDITTLEALENAPIEEIENRIKRLGLYKNKAANIKGIVHKIITDFNGELPSDKNLLQTLPGIVLLILMVNFLAIKAYFKLFLALVINPQVLSGLKFLKSQIYQ